jgi:hypothetical protein
MKNTNKPQWLLDAEKDINEFHETKYGKMSESNYNRGASRRDNIEGQKKAAQAAKISREDSGYYQSEKHINAAKKGGAATGSIIGKKHVETGFIKVLQKIGTKASLELRTCSICGESVNTGNHSKWHEGNCEYPNVIKLLNEMPNQFTKKQLKIKSIELFGNESLVKKLICGYMNLITKIYEGTNGSIIDVPIWKKKQI